MQKRLHRVFVIILVSLFGTISLSFSDAQQDLFKDVENAFNLGNSGRLESLISSSVELELPGEQEGIYSKSQTIAILDRFFHRFPPKSFKIVHTGNSASGAKFAVGDYVAESERSFRVTFFAKYQQGAYSIQEIEFE